MPAEEESPALNLPAVPATVPLPTASSFAALPFVADVVDPPNVMPQPTAIARLIDAVFPSPVPTATTLPTATFPPTATAVPCQSPGQIVSGLIPSNIAGQSPYRIYLPPCYGQDGRVYPAIYLLPGNIHTDGIWDELGMDEAAERAIDGELAAPLLIVMASGGQLANVTSGGAGSYESFIIDDLIPYIESTYCTWKTGAGRAIGGMSRGGYWALEIAFRNPDKFTSVGGHSASLYDYYGGPDVQPQQTGLTNDLGDLRIYFDVGENDWVIPAIQQLHEDMDVAGRQHAWVLNDGWHENAYWASHTPEYFKWYAEPWSLDRDTYPPCDIPPEQ